MMTTSLFSRDFARMCPAFLVAILVAACGDGSTSPNDDGGQNCQVGFIWSASAGQCQPVGDGGMTADLTPNVTYLACNSPPAMPRKVLCIWPSGGQDYYASEMDAFPCQLMPLDGLGWNYFRVAAEGENIGTQTHGTFYAFPKPTNGVIAQLADTVDVRPPSEKASCYDAQN